MSVFSFWDGHKKKQELQSHPQLINMNQTRYYAWGLWVKRCSSLWLVTCAGSFFDFVITSGSEFLNTFDIEEHPVSGS